MSKSLVIRNGRAAQSSAQTFDLQSLEPRRLFSGGTDMVLHWNDVMIDVLRADRTLPGPGWSSRAMAITNLSIFDAANTIDGSYQPYLMSPRGFNSSNTSMDAAIASAAHAALSA